MNNSHGGKLLSLLLVTLAGQTPAIAATFTCPPANTCQNMGSLSFGNQVVGTTSAGQPIDITYWLPPNSQSLNGDFVYGSGTTCRISTPQGSACRFVIQFKPTQSGARTGYLALKYSQGFDYQYWNLTGTGVPPPQFSISGTISGLGGDIATVALSWGTGTRNILTDTVGNFTFGNLSNATYTVTPAPANFTFTPSSRTVVVNGSNVTGVTFAAVAIPKRLNPCDINSDGLNNVLDVQRLVNEILSFNPPLSSDVNGDGAVNVLDLQRTINAVLGGGCITN